MSTALQGDLRLFNATVQQGDLSLVNVFLTARCPEFVKYLQYGKMSVVCLMSAVLQDDQCLVNVYISAR